MVPNLPAGRKCLVRAVATIIWPVRIIQPQPQSEVKLELGRAGNFRLYVNQGRVKKSFLNPSILEQTKPEKKRH